MRLAGWCSRIVVVLGSLAVVPLLAQSQADPWNFDGESSGETLASVLGPQVSDIVATIAFVTLALVSFFRKSIPLKYATLCFSLVYLGALRSMLMSVTDIFRLIDLSLPPIEYSVAWYLVAGLTVASTVLWGRLYCGRICAFGALTQLLDAVVPTRLRREPPPWIEERAALLKYGILALVLAYYVATDDAAVYRYVEPFWMFSGSATPLLWGMLAVLLLATLVVRNLYCRFLCPVGALLGLVAQVSTVFRIKRWKECRTCRICERACEWGAIRGPRIVRSECVRCDDCERLYADTSTCVHWVVLQRRSSRPPAPLGNTTRSP